MNGRLWNDDKGCLGEFFTLNLPFYLKSSDNMRIFPINCQQLYLDVQHSLQVPTQLGPYAWPTSYYLVETLTGSILVEIDFCLPSTPKKVKMAYKSVVPSKEVDSLRWTLIDVESNLNIAPLR